ncbi:MAG: glycosyltransferase, partial [Myxococcales bacterium]|nr:glycosyltransferase [Myxococcales bacterium]
VAGFDRQAFRAALRRCAAVIATAGSNLLAECVLLNKPILALHARGDHEQRLNGLLAADAGVAEAATIGDPALAEGVRRFLDRVERGGFSRVELAAALPPVSTATATLAEALLDRRRLKQE